MLSWIILSIYTKPPMHSSLWVNEYDRKRYLLDGSSTSEPTRYLVFYVLLLPVYSSNAHYFCYIALVSATLSSIYKSLSLLSATYYYIPVLFMI
ncbi:hypothetical protein V8C40DRAFT_45636 [Trichoderma camerunense]